jgi:hypothetical protein
MLENDEEDQLQRWCEKEEVLHRAKEDRNIIHNIKTRKANWICHIFLKNWFLKYATERMIEGRIEGKTRKKT